jgi:ankyrin repeat protein
MSGLFAAIEAHDRAAIESALAAGDDANAVRQDPPHWRPLHAAIEELESGGPIDALTSLIAHGADVNAWDGDGEATPLLMASFRDSADAVRVLLAAGADPVARGVEGDTPLCVWVAAGDHVIVRMLLVAGASRDVDRPGDLEGLTALGIAARRLDLPMIELLIAHGADPDALDADKRRAAERLPVIAADPAALERARALLASRG